MRRIVLRILGGVLFALLLAALLCAFAAWLLVRPSAGAWSTTLPLWRGGPRVTVSVPRLIELATDSRVGPRLDGRELTTRFGLLRFAWQADTLVVRCAPCTLHLAALGDEPLRLAQGELALRQDGRGRYLGHFASGAVVLPWRGTLTAKALALEGPLGPRPIADVYGVFGAAIPELRRARIAGEIDGRWRVSLPDGVWSVKPVLQGFEVDGLGTEALWQARLPARCAPGTRKPVPALVEQAVIAAEDQRFFEHPGYDLGELLASFDANQRTQRTARGGSTLTQQLAKQLYTGDARSTARKLRELLYAVEMERTLGKRRIVRLYLALAPWGDGVCGAHQASRALLHKHAHELDAVEAAWLASLLRNPALISAPIDHERLVWIVKAMPAPRAEKRRRVEEAEVWSGPLSAEPPAASR
jgi:hypothetical protein